MVTHRLAVDGRGHHPGLVVGPRLVAVVGGIEIEFGCELLQGGPPFELRPRAVWPAHVAEAAGAACDERVDPFRQRRGRGNQHACDALGVIVHQYHARGVGDVAQFLGRQA